MELKEVKVDFLLHILKNKSVTKNSQKLLSGLDYYFMVWSLRDAGIIVNDGIAKTNEKIWVLTEKGSKVAEMMPELKKLYVKEKEINERIKELVA